MGNGWWDRKRRSARGTGRAWLAPGLALIWLVFWLVAPIGIAGANLATAAGVLPPLLLAIPGFLGILWIAVRLVWKRKWKRDPLLLAGVLALTLIVADVQFGFTTSAGPDAIRMMTFNVFYRSKEMPHVAKFIREERLDLVVLQEHKPGSRSPLDSLKQALPDWHFAEAGDVVIMSRWPLAAVKSFPMQSLAGREILSVEVVGPRRFRVVGAHWSSVQIKQGWRGMVKATKTTALDIEVTKRALGEGSALPTILAGDFNATQRHPAFRELRGWENAFDARGMGLGSTFSVAYRLVRIDHIFVNSRFKTCECHVGPDFGSDHLPLLATIDYRD